MLPRHIVLMVDCNKSLLTTTTTVFVQTCGGVYSAVMVVSMWRYPHTVRICRILLGNAAICDNRKHPSSNEWFWQMPALGSIFYYIGFRYSYTMGN
jgi:hypothetical protein